MSNSAFCFVKPHANNEAVVELVKSSLNQAGITINKTGTITGPQIDAQKLIDQHYYSIASKATILDPTEIPVPEDKFEAKFGVTWKATLEAKKAANAMQACEKFGITPAELEKVWRVAEGQNNITKFGGGFYCGLLIHEGVGLYVFNAFFMNMRGMYVGDEDAITYFSVTWDKEKLSWADFRNVLVGPTNPADGLQGKSIRRAIFDQWESLGLKFEPNRGENGLHASASPLEGLGELNNWLGIPYGDQVFGKSLINLGVTEDTLVAWCRDARVTLDVGRVGSIFDEVEDKDSEACLAALVAINAL